EPDISSEESVSTVEEQENVTPPATSSETEHPKGDPENEEKEENKSSEETKKDEKDQSKEKEKKVKKTIPSWATLSASQLARAQKQTPMASSPRPKMDAILTEAIKASFYFKHLTIRNPFRNHGLLHYLATPNCLKNYRPHIALWLCYNPLTFISLHHQACFQKSGASVVAIRKYIIHKYPSLELERRGYLLKQALKRELSRGVIKQNRSSAVDPEPQVKLEDILPLAFTRLCEPKEASYSLIRKYVSQYYPKLRVDIRPQLLKNALQRALKKSGEKPLLGGSLMEYAILSAIAAMNEPKTCSTTALKKYVLENHPGTNSNYQMNYYNRHNGAGPGVLFPKKEPDDSKDEDEDEDDSSEADSEDEEPPPKRRLQKKTPAKSSEKAASVRQRGSKPAPKVPAAQRGKARPLPKKAPPKAKTPAKKARPSPSVIKKPSGGSSKKPVASVRKEVKLPGKGKSTMKKSFKTKK
ncbi:hypothetical protein MC885_005980, partial [Smutsia gigantea]